MKSNPTNNFSIKPVIVLGAGGHAKVLIEILEKSGRKIIGVTDPGKVAGEEFMGTVLLGDDSAISKVAPDEVELVNGIGAMPGKNLRWKLVSKMEAKGYFFSQVIHPSAVVANNVILEYGVQIMAGVIIQPGVRIGRSCIINTGVIIDHDCEINDNCHLAPGVALSGGVVIGEGTHIGTGVAIIDGVTIGANSIIAAGSIVHSDVVAGTKYIQPKKELLKKVDLP